MFEHLDEFGREEFESLLAEPLPAGGIKLRPRESGEAVQRQEPQLRPANPAAASSSSSRVISSRDITFSKNIQ